MVPMSTLTWDSARSFGAGQWCRGAGSAVREAIASTEQTPSAVAIPMGTPDLYQPTGCALTEDMRPTNPKPRSSWTTKRAPLATPKREALHTRDIHIKETIEQARLKNQDNSHR
jgi:hypothetical protein